MRARPLSPHLSVYRFTVTMTLSILHRLTGLALSASLLLLAFWLMAIAAGPAAYARAQLQLTHPLVKLIWAALIVTFAFHFLNGLRHLVWDAGYGLERVHARRSAWLVLAVTVLLAIALMVAFGVKTGRT